MKFFLYFLFICQSASSLQGQTDPTVTAQEKSYRFGVLQRPLPPEIQKLIKELGRAPKNDLDRDGWDDLWQLVYGFSRDGRNFFRHLQPDPTGDADGDGISNFEEMLDMRNPWGADVPIRKLTPEEVKTARAAAYRAARKNDAKVVSRYQELLDSRGVLIRGEERELEKPAPEDSGEYTGDETSFYFPDLSSDPSRQMFCTTAGGPEIIFAERLSAGNFLFAWEGEDEKLYDVEWSNDLEKWHRGGQRLPVMGGVGTWGQLSLAQKRFYRVTESDVLDTIPSDPSGGDGISTFGATLTPVLSNGAPHTYLVTVNLPAGVSASGVELVVDGEVHSQCAATGTSEVFSGPIYQWSLSEGSHTIHALVHADGETTAAFGQSGSGVLRSPSTTFSLGQNYQAVAFRVSETQIAADDPDLPALTEIAVDIPYDPQGAGSVQILDEEQNLVREWEWGLDDYPLEFRQAWDGTDYNGSPVAGGSYSVELNFGGGGFNGGTYTVAAGQRTWEALCLMEGLTTVPKIPEGLAAPPAWNAYASQFLPTWAHDFLTSGNGWDGTAHVNTSIHSAWGPWERLGSITNIVEEIKGRAKDDQGRKVFGLGNTGKWRIRQWQSGARYNDSVPDPVAAFVAGQNPFNDYEIGVFLGHGVACKGEPKAGSMAIPRPPQHYFPLVTNTATGAAHWVGSAVMPKYGTTGSKLKWMFLMTCNPLLDVTGNAIYDACKANGSLPFGPELHVLCGYNSKIWLEKGMGTLLSDALVNRINGQQFRDGTVVNAWGHVWDRSDNKNQGKIARAVYWPACKDDTIYGVKHEKIGNPPANAPQSALEERDFPN
ncbi:hypothetical protein [Haloferula sp.]|uniref:hypothetical protein n=1 Tax=Haloferula sp. TaxID=2497595 RepID=UPI003C77A112